MLTELVPCPQQESSWGRRQREAGCGSSTAALGPRGPHLDAANNHHPGQVHDIPSESKKDSVYPAGPLQCDNSELASQHYISKYRAVLAVLLASLADGVVCCRSVVSALFEAPQNAELQGGGLEHAHTYRIPRGEQPRAQFSSN